MQWKLKITFHFYQYIFKLIFTQKINENLNKIEFVWVFLLYDQNISIESSRKNDATKVSNWVYFHGEIVRFALRVHCPMQNSSLHWIQCQLLFTVNWIVIHPGLTGLTERFTSPHEWRFRSDTGPLLFCTHILTHDDFIFVSNTTRCNLFLYGNRKQYFVFYLILFFIFVRQKITNETSPTIEKCLYQF